MQKHGDQRNRSLDIVNARARGDSVLWHVDSRRSLGDLSESSLLFHDSLRELLKGFI